MNANSSHHARIVMSFYAKDVMELFSTLKGCAAVIKDDVPTAVVEEDYPDAYSTQTVSDPAQAQTSVQPTVSQPQPAPAPAPAAAPSTTASAPVPTAPPQPPAASVAPQVPTASAPAYSYEAVCKAGADLAASRPDLMPSLTALLQKFGVQAVTDLKPEQLGAFATELRQLGADI